MRRGALPIVLVLSTLVACGVPVDDEPRPIAGGELPGDLVSPSTSTSSPTRGVSLLARTVARMPCGERTAIAARKMLNGTSASAA